MWRKLKEEKPLLLIVCPPCTAFSPIQELNYAKLPEGKMAMILRAGLYHLELTAAVMKWHIAQGRYVFFEHPAPAKSWEEECIQAVAHLPGVVTTVDDQCLYGLNVDGTGPNKETTRWLTKMEELVQPLSKRCNKKHFHVPLEGGNQPETHQSTPEHSARP